MGKCYELSQEKDAEIVEAVKQIMLNQYPKLENRMDILFDYPNPAMDIAIRFYKDEKRGERTRIQFLNGHENAKISMSEYIIIDGLLSLKALCDIISFLLSDHDRIGNINRDESKINMTFVVDMRDDNMQGVGCGPIGLELDFHQYKNYESLQKSYLKVIAGNFYEQLKGTPSFRREYNEYCSFRKQVIINSFTEETLHQFIRLLDNKDLCELLLELPNDRFLEVYDTFSNTKEQEGKQLFKIENKNKKNG